MRNFKFNFKEFRIGFLSKDFQIDKELSDHI